MVPQVYIVHPASRGGVAETASELLRPAQGGGISVALSCRATPAVCVPTVSRRCSPLMVIDTTRQQTLGTVGRVYPIRITIYTT